MVCDMQADLFEQAMQNAADVQRFVFAGRALFTIQSKRTNIRYTFKVRKNKKGGVYFVEVLHGPCNESDYGYLGYVHKNNLSKIQAGKKGRPEAVSFKAFNWLIHNLDRGVLHDTVDFYHSGKCGKCGRTLTVPESIETGLGPVCAGRLS